MGIEEKKKEDEQQKVTVMQYELDIKCSVCQGQNKVVYVPHFGNEIFVCSHCKNDNRIVMTFLAIPENQQGMRTMMIKPNEKRAIGEIKRNVSNSSDKCDRRTGNG